MIHAEFEVSTPVLARRAKLNCFSWRKPKPPSSFESHSLSQLSHAIFLSSRIWPHQKFQIILVMSSQRESGILKHPIVHVGIAWATAFISTSFPALDCIFSFHLANFLLSFSLIALKEFLLFLPTRDGRPKYFSCCLITCAPNLLFISCWMSDGVLLLKNKEVFVRFSCCPEAYS